MSPQRVAIVDDKGDLLAGGDDKTGADATASDEEEQTTDFEDRLRQRIESIVASVVGPGHVRVQVAADMNYNHISETSETYDPDSKVVRSTQTVEQNATDTTGSGNNGASRSRARCRAASRPATGASAPTNPTPARAPKKRPITKSPRPCKTSTLDGGTVKQPSVAVVVDGVLDRRHRQGRLQAALRPGNGSRSKALVKSAIGYDKTRGDQVQVVNMPFAESTPARSTPASDAASRSRFVETGSRSSRSASCRSPRF